MTWISVVRWKYASPISARWWASTRIGRRCMSAANCSRKTWTQPTRGNSRTFGWSRSRVVLNGHDGPGVRARWRRPRVFVVETFPEPPAAERRIQADVAGRHVEFMGADEPIPAQVARGMLELNPGAEIYPVGIPAGAA